MMRYVELIVMLIIVPTITCSVDNKPSLSTAEVTSITSTTAISGGNIIDEGSSEVTERGVCLSISPSPTVSDKKTSDGSGTGEYTSFISGLARNSKYYLRAFATNHAGTSYGEEKSFTTAMDGQIIADHNAVDDFDKIPDNYITEVKKMLVSFVGESHAYGFLSGLDALENSMPEYACNIGTGEMPSSSHLRVNSGPTVGEAEWFTWKAYPTGSQPSERLFIKNLIKEYHDHGHPFSAIGFGWCWDMVGLAVAGGESETDPVYGCKYWGVSEGGPDGNLGWGLDAADFALSGNRVCLDTYLEATQDYIDYCAANGYGTKVIFTTGPVDGGGGEYFRGEKGYQGYLKNERIREYARADQSRILFDYADILSYDNNGQITNTTWNGHTYPVCTTANEYPVLDAHISRTGEIRLARATWWMLARIAGWDGISSSQIPISSITITGGSSITTRGGTLQLTAAVQPSNATNKAVTWSLTGGSAYAFINSTTGLLTAVANGTVTVRVTANDGSGEYGTATVTITNQNIPVAGITIAGGNSITTRGGTLQLTAAVQPSNATNKAVTWSLTGGSAYAFINSTTGLLTAVANGTVTVRVTANDGSGVYGTTAVTISGQSIQAIPVTSISVTGGTSISIDGGTLQLYATVLPSNATEKSVAWSVSSISGQATVDGSGLVRAVSNGTVAVKATAKDGSGVSGTLTITIANQVVEVKSITITVSKGTAAITVDDGTLTLNANVIPSNATNKTVKWSVSNETGYATISSAGILTAVANGIVKVEATASDGSGISSTLRIAISNQINQIESITIMAENGISSISDSTGTLQLKVVVAPYYATNKEVIWSINNITGRASIDETGLVTAISNGVVTVKAVAADGSGVSGVMDLSINLVPSDPLLVIVGENDLRIPINEHCADCRMSLYDMNGRLLDTKPVESNMLVFERSNLRSGIYLVVLDNKYAILKTGKVIIHN